MSLEAEGSMSLTGAAQSVLFLYSMEIALTFWVALVQVMVCSGRIIIAD